MSFDKEAEVVICNQALDRIGSKNFTYASQAGVEYEKCNNIYTQTRDALLSGFPWPFASARKSLSYDTTTPDFEWSYRYKLPSDYLRLIYNYTTKSTTESDDRQIREGDYILTNYDECEIKYTRKITDPADFDPLFTELLILTLAKKLITALPGTKNPGLVDDVRRDLAMVTARVRAVCRAEVETSGRSDWNLARYGSGKV